MNERELVHRVGRGASPYSLINAIMMANARVKANLTPEQRAEREEEIRMQNEQRYMRSKILEGSCPNCNGKVIRGKKNKKNNYRRSWTCKDCGSSYSM